MLLFIQKRGLLMPTIYRIHRTDDNLQGIMTIDDSYNYNTFNDCVDWEGHKNVRDDSRFKENHHICGMSKKDVCKVFKFRASRTFYDLIGLFDAGKFQIAKFELPESKYKFFYETIFFTKNSFLKAKKHYLNRNEILEFFEALKHTELR